MKKLLINKLEDMMDFALAYFSEEAAILSGFVLGGIICLSPIFCDSCNDYFTKISESKTKVEIHRKKVAEYKKSYENNKYFFKLDIRKSGKGKYYGDFDMFPNLNDSNSTRTFYYNLDNDTNTVEQVIEFKSNKNGRYWIPIKNLVSKGVMPYNTDYDVVSREMTSEEQKKYNEQFSLEQRLWEKERISPF